MMRASSSPSAPSTTCGLGQSPHQHVFRPIPVSGPFHLSPQASPYPLFHPRTHPAPHATPALSTTSSSTSLSVASQRFSPDEDSSPDFVARVSGIPLVNTALRAYEQGKASSRVVKYGAEIMESSVKSISKPVINRLPVNQLDEFACRQLDKLEKYGSSSQDLRPPEVLSSDSSDRPQWEHGALTRDQSFSESPATSREPSAGPSDEDRVALQDDRLQDQQDIAARSKWQALLLEAGGIGAAVSEESMRKLKYCLQWLQYATDHIDSQILVLRNFISSLSPDGDDPEEKYVSVKHLQTLTDVKRDVVNTIRQVVDVVSKYAGGALPEPARARVRQFILHLPQRWASTAQRQTAADDRAKRSFRDSHSRSSSTSSLPPLLPNGSSQNGILPPMTVLPPSEKVRTGVRPTAAAATQAAQRILTLATESLDMMRSVACVFKESLDRAEAWIERLRVVGIQRHHQRQRGESEAVDPATAATGTFAYQPPPADSAWPYNAPSPTGITASSLGALTLSSTYDTPKTRYSSLPGNSDQPQGEISRGSRSALSSGQADNERAGISAIRGTVERTTSGMDVDD